MQGPQISFPKPGFQALIFDLDGTVVDSMPTHFVAWCRALADHGQPNVFPEDVFYSMGGMPTGKIVEILNEKHGLDLNPAAVADSKRIHFLECLDQVTFIDEVIEFARVNHGKVPMAIASGGSRHVVGKTLQILGVEEMFDAVVTADDVVKCKPAPDIFLEAAKRLGVDPEGCVVFEDAPAGIEAGHEAGMEVVVIPLVR